MYSRWHRCSCGSEHATSARAPAGTAAGPSSAGQSHVAAPPLVHARLPLKTLVSRGHHVGPTLTGYLSPVQQWHSITSGHVHRKATWGKGSAQTRGSSAAVPRQALGKATWTGRPGCPCCSAGSPWVPRKGCCGRAASPHRTSRPSRFSSTGHLGQSLVRPLLVMHPLLLVTLPALLHSNPLSPCAASRCRLRRLSLSHSIHHA